MTFEETVDELYDEFREYDGREFEEHVREALAEEGYDTVFLQDFVHDDTVENYYRVDTEEGEYRISIAREPETDIEVYSTPDS